MQAAVGDSRVTDGSSSSSPGATVAPGGAATPQRARRRVAPLLRRAAPRSQWRVRRARASRYRCFRPTGPSIRSPSADMRWPLLSEGSCSLPTWECCHYWTTQSPRMLHRRRSRPTGGLCSTALGGRCFFRHVRGTPTITRESPTTAAPAGCLGCKGCCGVLVWVDPHPRRVGTKIMRARPASRHKNKQDYTSLTQSPEFAGSGGAACSRTSLAASSAASPLRSDPIPSDPILSHPMTRPTIRCAPGEMLQPAGAQSAADLL